ncbi:MAG TPA: PIN domain-containing protein [Pirellulales bacterium]|nr:PIN domain-containing protein [Pirellulales bacterium]
MTLIDAGPLVALLDQRDEHHSLCIDAAQRLRREPVLTTWPCLTEAMYLLHQAAGHAGVDCLWRFVATGWLALHDLGAEEVARMAELMARYHDLPMDLADASIVAAAESLGLRQVFTLDSDFRIYKLADGSTLDVIP